MDNLLILVENEIFRNSEQKYGINFLNKFYKIYLYDLSGYIKEDNINNTNFISKNYEYLKVYDLEKFETNLKKVKFKFAIDFLAYSKKAFLIRKYLEKKSIKIVKKQGSSPSLSSFKNSLIIKNFKYLMNKIKNKNFSHDIGISECLFSDKNFFIKHAKKKIFSHSEDYNEYINYKGNFYQNDKKYAVFIDDMISNHPDYKTTHLVSPPTDLDLYLSELNSFFDKFENKTGLEIIISPHPKANQSYKEKLISHRKFFDIKTMELIKNSELVFVHESTAISFPIIFNKPIIYLKNNQIIKSWMNKFIDLKAKNTGSKIVNISENSFEKININNIYNLNSKKYSVYIMNYIKHPASQKIDTWEALFQELNV